MRKWVSPYPTDPNKKTELSICRSEMKPLAAILVGQIQYIEISLMAAFSIDDCWNAMNALKETEKSRSYC